MYLPLGKGDSKLLRLTVTKHIDLSIPIEPYTDRGILLKDIVEDGYIHSAAKRTRPIVTENHRKSLCLEVNGMLVQ